MCTRIWTLSARDVMLISLLVVLGLSAFAVPCGARSATDDDELAALLDSMSPADLGALITQSEADSLRIRELEIKLFWSQQREKIAEDEKPGWIERFLSRYGFALGAAAGVYVGAAAAR